MLRFSTDEIMTIAASRELSGARSCFVGIGLPSIAANLARSLHSPGLVLVYESGTIGAKPTRLPLSIGDGELANTADVVVSVPEIFNYWLQPGRIDVGMIGGAQIDRFANINTTVIGPYDRPMVRLPGAGGAPEIAGSCPRVIVVMRQSTRTFVDKLDYLTTVGFGTGAGARSRLGMPGAGPRVLISDLGIFRPNPETFEMTLTALHPGVSLHDVREATDWDLAFSSELTVTPEPTDEELGFLRRLHAGQVVSGKD